MEAVHDRDDLIRSQGKAQMLTRVLSALDQEIQLLEKTLTSGATNAG